jgi:transposase
MSRARSACPRRTLRRYVRQVETDEGPPPDPPSWVEREEIKTLRKEVYELRRANEILKAIGLLAKPELGDLPELAECR